MKKICVDWTAVNKNRIWLWYWTLELLFITDKVYNLLIHHFVAMNNLNRPLAKTFTCLDNSGYKWYQEICSPTIWSTLGHLWDQTKIFKAISDWITTASEDGGYKTFPNCKLPKPSAQLQNHTLGEEVSLHFQSESPLFPFIVSHLPKHALL